MVIGILGMGAGFGFFFGPQYAGWRAQTAGWHWGMIADWQRPCIELGAIGIIVGVLFLIFASEPRKTRKPRSADEQAEDGVLPNRVAIEAIVTELRTEHARQHPKLTWDMRRKIIQVAALLMFRDFAGIASLSLLSIYLQKAHGYSTKQAGFVVGAMMLLSIIVNPLSVWISPGRRRLPTLSGVLIIGGSILLTVPMLPAKWVLPVMCVFQAFQMGSYAVSDAAILERVSPAIRGRVVGLFLTLAGTFASLAPWAVGYWTDLLRDRASEPHEYLPIFATLSGMMWVASSASPLIARLGESAVCKPQAATLTATAATMPPARPEPALPAARAGPSHRSEASRR
jgi:MFS family permease